MRSGATQSTHSGQRYASRHTISFLPRQCGALLFDHSVGEHSHLQDTSIRGFAHSLRATAAVPKLTEVKKHVNHRK